ncbi:L,D-transpeptidase [Paenibacillus sp. GCM10023248]|uniref:L,D-transpeptidase n=1 Tax=unclassified Paenibacillus TaxID=185978 RepID=UPI00237880B1|nr:L,D-transpeptidase [Paenibacillus sp. MAHUQ-63]MDD9265664.1 L,D-transpeptidase [Paenibacillus sp. MAHUQ-63]
MNRKNDNERLEKFFQHNPIEDPLYLKKYVKDHPDHKMAWYLLGREYAAQGKEGKAAYCFAQSGEIYEAFERQKITIEGPLPEYPPAASKGAREAVTAGRAKGKGRWMPLMVLLLLLAVPAAIDSANSGLPKEAGKAGAGLNANAAASATPPVAKQEGPTGTRLYFAEGDWSKKLEQVLASSGSGAGEAVIMQAPRSADGKWKEWHKAVSPLLSVMTQPEGGGAAALKVYQSQVCSCQLADSTALTPAIDQWMRDREQAIVLQSAIQAYGAKNGAPPESAAQLTKPYPDNLLPGLTPELQELFPQALGNVKAAASQAGRQAADDKSVQSPPAAQERGAPGSTQPKASADPLQEPLRIVIDTEKHRLALVSGSYILRSYPVGLGGDKTPQGEFYISEKVRNPNGKSNGEFGSRGMTLSDTLYAIHGTNKPSSIGKDESHGCVRMLQADVEELYNMVAHQTKVTIGKGILPAETPGAGDGSGGGSPGVGAGRGKPDQTFGLPLQTNDSNPGKKYKWLD